MTTNQPLAQPLTVAAAAVLTGATLFLAGFWAGSARGGSENAPTVRPAPMPAWFGPVWDYYDRNPAVTPAFAFGALYAGETPAAVAQRR